MLEPILKTSGQQIAPANHTGQTNSMKKSGGLKTFSKI